MKFVVHILIASLTILSLTFYNHLENSKSLKEAHRVGFNEGHSLAMDTYHYVGVAHGCLAAHEQKKSNIDLMKCVTVGLAK